VFRENIENAPRSRICRRGDVLFFCAGMLCKGPERNDWCPGWYLRFFRFPGFEAVSVLEPMIRSEPLKRWCDESVSFKLQRAEEQLQPERQAHNKFSLPRKCCNAFHLLGRGNARVEETGQSGSSMLPKGRVFPSSSSSCIGSASIGSMPGGVPDSGSSSSSKSEIS
jgi:hypothetical protein